MGAGIDVRIDAKHDARGAAHGGGEGRQHVQFLGAFHVDLRDVLGECQSQLAFALADAREHDSVSRDAGLARAVKLAFADDIGACALGREQAQHREPVVRLHRVMHVPVEAGVGQRAGEHAIAPAHGGRRIDPDRRADVIGDGVQRHVVDQHAVHRMHGEMRPRRDQLGDRGFGRVRRRRFGHGLIRVHEVESRGHSNRNSPWQPMSEATPQSSAGRAEDCFAPDVTFTVMAALVPAIGRGALPLRMAATSPAMTAARAGLIQGGSAGRTV